MSRRQKCRLRELTPEERAQLEPISRAHAVPASHVARAKALLAVAAQHSDTAAARQAGRRPGDAVAMRVARFNREGMAAVFPRPGGGRPARYTVADRERLLAEARRVSMATRTDPLLATKIDPLWDQENPAFRLKLSQILFSTTCCTPVHASCPDLMRQFLPGSPSPPGPQKGGRHRAYRSRPVPFSQIGPE